MNLDPKYIKTTPIGLFQRFINGLNALVNAWLLALINFIRAPVLALQAFAIKEKKVADEEKFVADLFSKLQNLQLLDGPDEDEEPQVLKLKLEQEDNEEEWKKLHRKLYEEEGDEEDEDK